MSLAFEASTIRLGIFKFMALLLNHNSRPIASGASDVLGEPSLADYLDHHTRI